MPIADHLLSHPTLYTLVAGLIGATVGSFLNVVIHRLPLMMEREWRHQCDALAAETSGTPAAAPAAQDTFNLAVPGSRCPHCGHNIRAWENIPILSYLLLRGKCSQCAQAISIRYPIVEAITGLLSMAVAWHFGFGWESAAALVLTWALVPLTVIDLDRQLLPDAITLPLLWLGLALSLFGIFTDPPAAIIGAMAGYLSLWSVYWGFKLLTGKEGMGFGDFKLLALFGAWLGWQMLPVVIFLSAIVGSIVGIALIALKRHDQGTPIPFGPYLAGAGWIALLWGEEISQAYLRFSGLN